MIQNEAVLVAVTIDTYIIDGEHEQTTSLSTKGKLFRKNDSLYLQFKEEDNQEVGEVNQVIKIDENKAVTVLRQGAVSMKQLFLTGEKTEGVYRSQFGTMLMDTNTNDIKIHIDEQQIKGSVQLFYQLHMQYEFAGNYEVTIKFRRSTNE